MLASDWLRAHPRGARLLALAAGASLATAFAPLDLYPLGLLAPALLLHLWLSAARPAQAAWIGFFFGLGLFGAGVSWVYVSLSVFGGMPAPVAVAATAGFCAYLALFPAAVGAVQCRIPCSVTLRALIVIPAVWTLSELARGALFTGFPWLALGYAASDTPLAGFAPLAGVYGVSFTLMLCAGLVHAGIEGRHRARCVAALLVVLGAGAGLRAVDWTSPVGPPLDASLLQGNIAQDLKFDPSRFVRTLQTYEDLAAGSSARLIVFPETALPRFLDRIDPAYLGRLEAIARRNDGDLLLGVPYRAASGAYFNAVVSLGTSQRQLYAKQHLVPFGEFIPPGFAWVPSVLQIPMSDFSRGAATQAPMQVAGQKVAVNICYEDAYGAELLPQAGQATLLANLSNVAWFGDSLAPAQHLQIARLRAIETGRALLTATNTGITAAIDRDGRVISRLPQFTEGRLDVRVQGYTGLTPYARWADWPALLVSAALIALVTALSALRRRR
jgi:apolipoprotein N-acyltransferase